MNDEPGRAINWWGDDSELLARSGARATEAARELLLFDAIANVVGIEAARSLFEFAENVPYPGEDPEDMETDRERLVREAENRVFRRMYPERAPAELPEP